jgi:hypothetical protein
MWSWLITKSNGIRMYSGKPELQVPLMRPVRLSSDIVNWQNLSTVPDGHWRHEEHSRDVVQERGQQGRDEAQGVH